MKLKVLRYCPVADYHQCQDEAGKKLFVYLFTNSKLKRETNESIVGKVVTCDHVAPHFYFSVGVSAVEAAGLDLCRANGHSMVTQKKTARRSGP